MLYIISSSLFFNAFFKFKRYVMLFFILKISYACKLVKNIVKIKKVGIFKRKILIETHDSSKPKIMDINNMNNLVRFVPLGIVNFGTIYL